MLAPTGPTIMASGSTSEYKKIAPPSTWNIKEDAAYVHYCQNETVDGFQFHEDESNSGFPHSLFEKLNMTVVCDMSSDIGSRKVDWNKYGMVYAGA